MKSRTQAASCPICDLGYSNKFNMQRHYSMVHLHLLRFTCEQCGKSLSSKQNHREHTYTHTGEKPYECKDCGALFRQCSQLSVHKRIHRGNEAYSCEFRLTDLLSPQKLKELETCWEEGLGLFQSQALPAFLIRKAPSPFLPSFVNIS
jgi:uncharacterized Zn-finger protein